MDDVLSLDVAISTSRFLLPALVSLIFRIVGLGWKGDLAARNWLVGYILYLIVVPYGLIGLIGYYPYTKIAVIVSIIPQLIVFPKISTDGLTETYFLHFTAINIVVLISIVTNIARSYYGLSRGVNLAMLLVLYVIGLIVSIKVFAPALRFMVDKVKMYRNLIEISVLNEENNAKDLLKVQVAALGERMKTMKENQEKMRVIFHDVRHFNGTLLNLIEENKIDEATKLLENAILYDEL
ncbi:MAG: hypothetical protein RR495_06035 [Anaerovoracaceae bacterium]